MNNNEIIEIINTINNQNFNTTDTQEINIEEIISALINGFYYVKSGKDTERFLDTIDCVIADTHKKLSVPHADKTSKCLIKRIN